MGAALKKPKPLGSGSRHAGGSYLQPFGPAALDGTGWTPPVLQWPAGGVRDLLRSNGRLASNLRTYIAAPPAPDLAAAGRPAEAVRNWAAIATEVESWSTLPADWDGEDGEAPSQAVVEAASSVVQVLAGAGARPGEHYVAGDGEVGLRWRTDVGFASISLVEDGHVLIYMHVGDEVLHNRDEAWSPDCDLSDFARDLARLA